MTRLPPRAVLALALVSVGPPALAQQGTRPPVRPGPDRPAPEKGATDKGIADKGGPAVIACPSLANYRLLMRAGAPAAAAVLADPRADHLGCAALTRGRIAGIADRVTLEGRNYDCATVQGTTACHWMEGGAFPARGPSTAGR